MQPRVKRKTERFNDGVLTAWEAKDHTLIREKAHLRFGNLKISMYQKYHDQVAGEMTDKIIAVPLNPFIEEKDIITIGEEQFLIRKKEIEILNRTEIASPSAHLT